MSGACGQTEGQLLWLRDATEVDAGAVAQTSERVAEPDAASLPAGEDNANSLRAAAGGIANRATVSPQLHYQLSGDVDLDTQADWFVLDLFDTDAAQVTALHDRGRRVMAYVSVGSLEPWRRDFDAFPEEAVGRALASYPAERWLDIRSDAVRALMRARFELASDKGFDGIFASALGAYRAQSGFALSEADQLDYDRFLATAARELSLSPGLSGDFGFAAELSDSYEWAIAVGCLAKDSCGELAPWVARGLPVFDIELTDDAGEVCARVRELDIELSVSVKRESFDAWSERC